MNPSLLTAFASEALTDEAQRRARESRRGRRRQRAAADADAGIEHMVIRSASASDQRALGRLAALDGGREPQLPALVAEVRGELVAAVDLLNGSKVADPFRRTADIVELLALRAAQLRQSADGAGRRVPALRPVLGHHGDSRVPAA